MITSRALICLSMLAACPLEATAGGGPNFLLKGMDIVSYQAGIEPTGAIVCKIENDRLDTALRFVANQSTKLKIVTQKEKLETSTELFDLASKDLQNDATFMRAHKYSSMPDLFIYVIALDVRGGCAATIEAEVGAKMYNEVVQVV